MTRSRSFHASMMLMLTLAAMPVAGLASSPPAAPPNPKRSRAPDDISARQRKRAEKLARRAARAASTPHQDFRDG